MVEGDAEKRVGTPDGARNSASRFTAFNFNNDRRAVPELKGTAHCCLVIGYLTAHGGGISIAQRDILRMGRCGCTDALGGAAL